MRTFLREPWYWLWWTLRTEWRTGVAVATIVLGAYGLLGWLL